MPIQPHKRQKRQHANALESIMILTFVVVQQNDFLAQKDAKKQYGSQHYELLCIPYDQ